jgi:hypothetical protein
VGQFVLYVQGHINEIGKEGSAMKELLVIMLAFGLTMIPFMVYGQPAGVGTAVPESEQTATDAPPVSQVLVAEGDFALRLAAALQLGAPTTDVQAEDMLTAVGITPRNGWIADYPMTPVVIGELQNAVVAASAAETISMGQDDALQAFQSLADEFGLSILPGTDQYGEAQPPPPGEYVPPAVVDDYYDEEGPPVVTYYAPPQDYYYLYSWVPYPFWCTGFYFPGFFILRDFDRTVVGHFHGRPHRHVITNHAFDRRLHRYGRVDPAPKPFGRGFRTSPPRGSRLGSPGAGRGATSIFNHGFERGRPGRAATGTTLGRFGGGGRNLAWVCHPGEASTGRPEDSGDRSAPRADLPLHLEVPSANPTAGVSGASRDVASANPMAAASEAFMAAAVLVVNEGAWVRKKGKRGRSVPNRR